MQSETVKKPWGSFTRFTNNEPSTVKILRVTKGEEFSLQYHQNREEFWKVLEGSPDVVVGEETHHAKKDDEFFIPKMSKHRISAPTDDVVVLEIALGVFDEDDIVRLEDKYGRVT